MFGWLELLGGRRWWSAALLAAAVACASQRASAQQTADPGSDDAAARAQARQRFEHGVADYDAGRYAQALENFQEAYRLRPHPLVHVNIANCYDRLGRPLPAIFHFQRFLEAQAGTSAQREEVAKALERLRKQIGQLLLHITPDGAFVVIDGGEQRRAPILEPIQLEAGRHTLEVRLPGYRTMQRTISMRGGMTLELNLALEREQEEAPVLAVTPASAEASDTAGETAGAAPAETGPVTIDAAHIAPLPPTADIEALSDEPDAQGLPTSVWIAGGVTAALATTAVVTGLLAVTADADFDKERQRLALATTPNDRVAIYADARDHADRAQALALTTDILLIATGVGAAVTTYLALTAHDGEPASARLAPVLGRRSAGVALHTAF